VGYSPCHNWPFERKRGWALLRVQHQRLPR
jgi:hypothetical protein